MFVKFVCRQFIERSLSIYPHVLFIICIAVFILCTQEALFILCTQEALERLSTFKNKCVLMHRTSETGISNCFVVRCSLFVVRCSLFVVRCSLEKYIQHPCYSELRTRTRMARVVCTVVPYALEFDLSSLLRNEAQIWYYHRRSNCFRHVRSLSNPFATYHP